MATERRRLMGELAAWHVATILGAFSGKATNPADLNPYREVKPLTAAQQRVAEWKRRVRWGAFVDGVGGNRRG